MKTTLPAEYLGERPAVSSIEHAMVFVVRGAQEDEMPPLVSLLELAYSEKRPVLLAGASLSPQGLATLQMNAAVARIVPVQLDEGATEQLVRVSGAQPIAFARPISFQQAGSVSRIEFGDRDLEVWGDPSAPKPAQRPAEPEPELAPEEGPKVARVRQDWLQLALDGAEPVRETPRDEQVWGLARKLAIITRRMAPPESSMVFEYVRTPPVEPEELSRLEAAIDGPLPEDFVAFALRLGGSISALPNFAVDFPMEPSIRELDDARLGRALRLGVGQMESDYNQGLWIGFGGRASGRVMISEEPNDQTDDDQEPSWLGRPGEGFLAWIDGALDLCLRMSEHLEG